MDKFKITGGTPLKGTIHVSGSKNAALPLMAASILGDGPSILRNIPRLNDIYTFNNVMRVTGTRVDFKEQENTIEIDPTNLSYPESPYELVRKMRASFYMLGALLAKNGYAKVSLPGGCAWGPRPVDLHIEGLKAFGAEIEMDKGYVIAKRPKDGLPGGEYRLNPSSVGATVNLLLAASMAKGTCIIKNAAKEPDVVQLCDFLVKMGAIINGVGTSTLTIQGVPRLAGAEFDNAPDRIEAGTYMIAGAMHPESEIELLNVSAEDLGIFPQWLEKTGVQLQMNGNRISVKAPELIKPVSIITEIYPGFPTDLQAQWAALMTQAQGESQVTDTIYPDRFSYVPEMNRLGASIKVRNNTAVINGKSNLEGTSVMSTDLRASVSLVMAAMVAEGESDVLRIYHLDRGYEKLEDKLKGIGANIERVEQGE